MLWMLIGDGMMIEDGDIEIGFLILIRLMEFYIGRDYGFLFNC